MFDHYLLFPWWISPDECFWEQTFSLNFVSASLFTSCHFVIDVYTQVFFLYHFTIMNSKFVVDNLSPLVYDLALHILHSVRLQFHKSLWSIQRSLNYVLVLFCICDISKSYHTSCSHTRMVRKTSNLGQRKDKYLKDSIVTLLQLQYFYSSPFSITLWVAYSIYWSYTSFNFLRCTLIFAYAE